MKAPARIPINREPGYHTDSIGTWSGGLFMAFIVAGFPKGFKLDLANDSWKAQKRWYCVVHLFDKAGNHTGTDAEFLGTTAEGERRVLEDAEHRLDKMLAKLGPRKLGNISVRLFEAEIDGVEFGLEAETYEIEGQTVERVTLWPNDLAFFEPWNGYYDT
jgi:formate hydrogenlyase regulatory protein HycA